MATPFPAYQVSEHLEFVQKILRQSAAERIFLVTGKHSYEASGAKGFLDRILRDLRTHRHNDFGPLPRIDDLCKGAHAFDQFKPDMLIAVGGGSIIDTAKLVSTLPADYGQCLDAIAFSHPMRVRPCKFIAVPTTAGSGSECTHFAVAYIGDNKFSVAHPALLPDYIILDPRLTYTMSPYQTAVSGMDALSQAIESYWAVGATSESREHAKTALAAILQVFPEVVQNPDNFSRKRMLEGAHAAGKAINISKTTAPHALSYILTTLYGIPHGHAVALTLPQFFEYNLTDRDVDSRGSDDAGRDEVNSELYNMLGCHTVQAGRSKLEHIIEQAGLETRLGRLGASDINDIDKIVDSVNNERLMNNPKQVDRKDLRRIVERIW